MKGIELCPDINKVFSDNFEENKKHFKPLASIDLSIIDSLLSGEIFLVYFNNDPYCNETVKSFNEFCNESKVSFDIIDNKYKFKTDFGYFQTNEDWKKWLLMGDKSYSQFLEKLKTENINQNEFLENLNGEPNWIQADETPMNSKGVPMKFICQMSSHKIVKDYCGEEIYLFYDPIDGIAVQVHQID
jgi:hypothetical protein